MGGEQGAGGKRLQDGDARVQRQCELGGQAAAAAMVPMLGRG